MTNLQHEPEKPGGQDPERAKPTPETKQASASLEEAAAKLTARLELQKQRYAWRKRINMAWRAAGKPAPDADAEAWAKVGAGALEGAVLDQVRLEMQKRWAWDQGAPFSRESLTSITHEVRRTQKRIDALRAAVSLAVTVEERGVCELLENVHAHLTQLLRAGKPAREIRALLKGWELAWSPSRGSWQSPQSAASRVDALIDGAKLKGRKLLELYPPADEPVLKLVETKLRSRVVQTLSAVNDSETAAILLHDLIGASDREEFVALLLNTRHRVTRVYKVSCGTLDRAQVHPREVFKAAVLANASAVVVGHNHPSGDPKESQDDKVIVERLREAGLVLGIEVLDAIIVTPSGAYFSASDGLVRQLHFRRGKGIPVGP